jgi:methylated-DNA-[protein]-cysteine S-methyltransferase
MSRVSEAGAGATISTFATPIGDCGIAWSTAGIRAVRFPAHPAALDSTSPALPAGPTPAGVPTAVQAVIKRLCALLGGGTDDLQDVAVDFGSARAFALQVYAVTRSVGPGRTTTYGEIAARLGAPHAAREVGQALGGNPVPLIVPCHRVLAADGKVGGFSAPGGVATKLRLLAIEGATPNGQPTLF